MLPAVARCLDRGKPRHQTSYSPLAKSWSTGEKGYEIPAEDHDLFSELVEKLGLIGKEDEWPSSPALYRFAQEKATVKYVPESLLKVWRIEPDVNLSWNF